MQAMTTEAATPKERKEYPESKRDALTRRFTEFNGLYPQDVKDLVHDLYSMLLSTEDKLKAVTKRSNNRHRAIKGMQTHTAKVIAENTKLKEKLLKID